MFLYATTCNLSRDFSFVVCVRHPAPLKIAAPLPVHSSSSSTCIILDDAPDRVVCQYNLLAMESLLECLQGGRGHLWDDLIKKLKIPDS
jgi:hypothetical protein